MSLLLASVGGGGPTNYADSLLVGSYVISGKTITDVRTRSDSLAVGAYSLSGKNITDVYAHNDNLSVGSYVISGKTVTDSVTRGDALSVGSYSISGKSITDVYARNDALSVGAYVISGKDITDVKTGGTTNYADALSVGSYVWSGQSITDLFARNDALSVGSYVIAGNSIADNHQHIEEQGLGGGSGYPVYGKYIRPKGIGEFLDVAMSELYEAGTEKDIPKATREQFAKVVKPYAKGKAKIPEVDKVNWKALEQDVERVEQLLALWQMYLDDEEVIIMAYLEYFH